MKADTRAPGRALVGSFLNAADVSAGANRCRVARYISGHHAFFFAAGVFAAVFLLFLPATRNGFVNYDDPVYVTENPHVQRGPTWENIQWAFTTGHGANWHPLTWLSHMLDCWAYGPHPLGHHLTSVLLHALNAALLFLVLHRLTGGAGRSLMVALLFGVHPLRVESVAWVAERKDVLSGFFFLLTILAYTRYARQTKSSADPSRLAYTTALVAFGFGLMSKPMLVTLPFVLLLLDTWPLERIATGKKEKRSIAPQAWSLVREKVPFFLLAAASSVVTFKVQEHGAAVVNSVSLFVRAENAFVSCGRYLAKLVWPVDLAVYYPHVADWPMMVVVGCVVFVAVVSLLAVRWWGARPYMAVGWFWFVGMLVPVIGLVKVGTQSMADRYTYLPAIGIYVMVVWTLADFAARSRLRTLAFSTAGVAAAICCAVLTHRQIGWWRDSETLFKQALATTGENSVALNNYARALGEKGRLDDAMDRYHAALRLNPDDPFARAGLGVVLMKKRNYDGAFENLQKARRIEPKNALTHYNLGLLQARRGLYEEAVTHFEEAVALDPHYADARHNLGAALAMLGRFAEAIPHYRLAIRLKPGHAMMHKNLGIALLEVAESEEAIGQLDVAVRLDPNSGEARNLLREVRSTRTSETRAAKAENIER